jgi:hypothetical protein
MFSKSALIMGLVSVGGVFVASGSGTQFPSVTGSNLQGDEVTFPRTLSAKKHDFLVVAFEQKQQDLVDTWLPELAKLSAARKDFAYYELPTLAKMNRLLRWTIYRGMRSGIKDPGARSRTVTLYIDKEPFKRQLGIKTEKDIFVFLLNAKGSVKWQAQGALTDAKLKTLKDSLK